MTLVARTVEDNTVLIYSRLDPDSESDLAGFAADYPDTVPIGKNVSGAPLVISELCYNTFHVSLVQG